MIPHPLLLAAAVIVTAAAVWCHYRDRPSSRPDVCCWCYHDGERDDEAQR